MYVCLSCVTTFIKVIIVSLWFFGVFFAVFVITSAEERGNIFTLLVCLLVCLSVNNITQYRTQKVVEQFS